MVWRVICDAFDIGGCSWRNRGLRSALDTTGDPKESSIKVLTVFANPNPKSFCRTILERFSKGLEEAGHTSERVDLYAIRFDPVFRTQDFASYVHESMPREILAKLNLKQHVLDSVGGPLQRFVASLWLRDKNSPAVARFIHDHRPKDVIAQWEKAKYVQGLAFIAPVYWCHFPAVIKGWSDCRSFIDSEWLHILVPFERLESAPPCCV